MSLHIASVDISKLCVPASFHSSARKHGVADEDIEHAIDNVMSIDDQDDDTRLYLGPARNADLLEVVTIIRDDGSELVIHAMKMRPKYRRLLPGGLTMARKKAHGKTAGGKPITDDLIDKLAKKAEAGYDVEETLRRRPGRPTIGSAPALVESVRLDPELREALDVRAKRDHEATSSVIRKALRQYLQAG